MQVILNAPMSPNSTSQFLSISREAGQVITLLNAGLSLNSTFGSHTADTSRSRPLAFIGEPIQVLGHPMPSLLQRAVAFFGCFVIIRFFSQQRVFPILLHFF